jgi:hypothetical protein
MDVVITTAILGAIAMVLAQTFKGLLPERPESEPPPPEGKLYPRDFLPLIMLGSMTVAGVGIGAYKAEDLLVWAIAGFLAGAESMGLYGGVKSIATWAGASSGLLSRATLTLSQKDKGK